MSFADQRELEDRARDTILGFAHEHAPLLRKCIADLAPGTDLSVASICLFLGNAAEQLMAFVGKEAVLDLVGKTLDQVETVHRTVAEAAEHGVALDPQTVIQNLLTQKPA
jgi:hypothetical protein